VPRTDYRGTADPNAPKGPPKDRYFPDETLEKDYKFKVLAVVVLDPAAAPKAEEAKPAEENK
jgi:hypothetical protein